MVTNALHHKQTFLFFSFLFGRGARKDNKGRDYQNSASKIQDLWDLLAEFSIASSDWCGGEGERRIEVVASGFVMYMISFRLSSHLSLFIGGFYLPISFLAS
jgi:hypothetical protein